MAISNTSIKNKSATKGAIIFCFKIDIMSDKNNHNQNEPNNIELKYPEFSNDNLHNNYMNKPYNQNTLNAPNQNDFMELS